MLQCLVRIVSRLREQQARVGPLHAVERERLAVDAERSAEVLTGSARYAAARVKLLEASADILDGIELNADVTQSFEGSVSCATGWRRIQAGAAAASNELPRA